MARKDQLKKLGMPKMPMAEQEAEMDLGMEEMDEMGAEKEMSEEEMVMDEMKEEGLASFSDAELLDELKLRGLSMNDLEEDEDMEMEDEDEDTL